jgi:hypothetical protein
MKVEQKGVEKNIAEIRPSILGSAEAATLLVYEATSQ